VVDCIPTRASPDLFGLIETTSKTGSMVDSYPPRLKDRPHCRCHCGWLRGFLLSGGCCSRNGNQRQPEKRTYKVLNQEALLLPVEITILVWMNESQEDWSGPHA